MNTIINPLGWSMYHKLVHVSHHIVKSWGLEEVLVEERRLEAGLREGAGEEFYKAPALLAAAVAEQAVEAADWAADEVGVGKLALVSSGLWEDGSQKKSMRLAARPAERGYLCGHVPHFERHANWLEQQQPLLHTNYNLYICTNLV